MSDRFCAGSRHGNYVIVEELERVVFSSGTKLRRFHCRCDCGVERVVTSSNLGRSKSCDGCRKPAPIWQTQRKLTDEEALAITKLRGVLSQRQIAARFNISQAAVNNVINRNSYRHMSAD